MHEPTAWRGRGRRGGCEEKEERREEGKEEKEEKEERRGGRRERRRSVCTCHSRNQLLPVHGRLSSAVPSGSQRLLSA